MAKNGVINKTTFTDQTNIQNNVSITVKAIHVNELRAAIGRLDQYAVNVDNCGQCACQNKCTCQSDKECRCEYCQDACLECVGKRDVQCKEGCQDTCIECTCQRRISNGCYSGNSCDSCDTGDDNSCGWDGYD